MYVRSGRIVIVKIYSGIRLNLWKKEIPEKQNRRLIKTKTIYE